MAAVPNAPGVPALLTGFDASISLGITLLANDLIAGLGGLIGPQWGIFSNGFPVVSADTVVSLDYKQESVVADYPLERGTFESYDKVQVPFDARVRFVAGGSDANRAALLASIAAIQGDFNLYDVVTPEAVYTSCNVMHHDYHRSSNNGLGLIQVDVWLRQIRIAVGTVTGSTAAASGADQVNGGSVQSTPATTAQQSTADAPASTATPTFNWFTQ